jgi:hypothetical protein
MIAKQHKIWISGNENIINNWRRFQSNIRPWNKHFSSIPEVLANLDLDFTRSFAIIQKLYSGMLLFFLKQVQWHFKNIFFVGRSICIKSRFDNKRHWSDLSMSHTCHCNSEVCSFQDMIMSKVQQKAWFHAIPWYFTHCFALFVLGFTLIVFTWSLIWFDTIS